MRMAGKPYHGKDLHYVLEIFREVLLLSKFF